MWSHYLHKLFHILLVQLLFFSYSALAQKTPEVWNLTSESPSFVGRESHLEKIFTIFEKSKLKTVFIVGGPGFGKTQIAKKYANTHHSEYQVVWWFNADLFVETQFLEFSENILNTFNKNAPKHRKKTSLNNVIKRVKDLIRKKNLKCLLIFDNVIEYSEIKRFIPFSHEGSVHVIVTSQNNNFLLNKISVGEFSEKESIEYINQFLPKKLLRAKQALAKYTYYHPSVLKLAISYIMLNPGMTINLYVNAHKQRFGTNESEIFQVRDEIIDSDYKMQLLTSIRLNMAKIKVESQNSYQLLAFISVLNKDYIEIKLLKKWMKKNKMSQEISVLIGYIKKYGFLDSEGYNSAVGAYVSMHDLIQKIVCELVSVKEKKKLLDDACKLLRETFLDRSDLVIEKIDRENTPLINALKVLDLSVRLNHRTQKIVQLRNRVFDVVLCGLRDFDKAKTILVVLQDDLKRGIRLSNKDYIQYLISLSFFQSMYNPNYKSAIATGNKALNLVKKEKTMKEEQIRLIANLLQFNSLIGDLSTCEALYQEGLDLLKISESFAYNALFVFATTLYLLDLGKNAETITFVESQKPLLEKLDNYPSLRFYILSELARACVKNKDYKKALGIIAISESEAKKFYGDEENTFFANLKNLKALCLLKSSNLKSLESTIKNSLRIFNKAYKGENKHRLQAEAHHILGLIYENHGQLKKAKDQYLKSEDIFEKILKFKAISDVSELYFNLAELGIKLKEEELTHTYLKKLIQFFGIDHKRTKDLIFKLDERGLSIPF